MSTLETMQLTVGDLIKGTALLSTIVAATWALYGQLGELRQDLAVMRAEMAHAARGSQVAAGQRDRNADRIGALEIRHGQLEARVNELHAR